MDIEDLRRSPRLKAIKSGQIIVDGTGDALDCTIRNISEHGAMLRFADEVDLPEKVQLVILSHDIHVRADVVWNNGAEAGIAFRPGMVGGAAE
jgi:hypothetical protein